jgi:hypothetical protein
LDKFKNVKEIKKVHIHKIGQDDVEVVIISGTDGNSKNSKNVLTFFEPATSKLYTPILTGATVKKNVPIHLFAGTYVWGYVGDNGDIDTWNLSENILNYQDSEYKAFQSVSF